MIKYEDSEIAQILPENLKNVPQVRAISYAISNTVKKLERYSRHSSVYAVIDILPEKMIDLLATELRAQYYDESLRVEQKREIVKNTVLWYYKAGTACATGQMVEAVFGTGKLTEWFEYGGNPYFFKIWTDVTITEENIKLFSKVVKGIKNTRSHLEGLELTREHWGDLYSAGYFRAQGRSIIKEEGL